MGLGFLDFRSNLVQFERGVVGSSIVYSYLSPINFVRITEL